MSDEVKKKVELSNSVYEWFKKNPQLKGCTEDSIHTIYGARCGSHLKPMYESASGQESLKKHADAHHCWKCGDLVVVHSDDLGSSEIFSVTTLGSHGIFCPGLGSYLWRTIYRGGK